ncbi:MAG: hypothetical protein MJ177_06390 [Clostridia bacterium]|nr:hypothetical protein [Clostridia bacterium]
MKKLKKTTAFLICAILIFTSIPYVGCVSAVPQSAYNAHFSDMPVVPDGYHYTGKNNISADGRVIYYTEDEPGEYGLVHGKWIYADGTEAENPDFPCVYPGEASNGYDKAAQLPGSFDSRNNGIITPVENQTGGTCWAHSAISCIETACIKQGLADEPDFSEYHTVWFGKNGYVEGENDPANDGFKLNNEIDTLVAGGNMNTVMNAVNNFSGVANEERFVLESDDEEQMLSDMKSTFTYDKKYIHDAVVSEINYLPDDTDTVKQAVSDYGAVKAS